MKKAKATKVVDKKELKEAIKKLERNGWEYLLIRCPHRLTDSDGVELFFTDAQVIELANEVEEDEGEVE